MINQRPYQPSIARKQAGDHTGFQRAWENIEALVPRWWVDDLIECSARLASAITGDLERVAYGWSGGKDSIALGLVMDAAGISDCVCVITRLEYPSFLAWATEWMPDGLTVVDRQEICLPWLATRPDMLFPVDARTANQWFNLVQRTGQREYYSECNLDGLIVGRRKADGNHPKQRFTDKDGRVWVSPILDWTHEDVLAACYYYGPPMPPMYGWPRGWQVGSGPWPARQWTDNQAHGWREVWEIDPSIVREAASYFRGAQECADLQEP